MELFDFCSFFVTIAHKECPYIIINIEFAQDRKPLGAEQQLRQVRRVADANLGQVAGGAEQQGCCLDSEQDHPQVSTFCNSTIFLLTKPSQVRVRDQRRVVNILLGCKVSVVEALSFYFINYAGMIFRSFLPL